MWAGPFLCGGTTFGAAGHLTYRHFAPAGTEGYSTTALIDSQTHHVRLHSTRARMQAHVHASLPSQPPPLKTLALAHTLLDCSVIVRDIDSRLGKRERDAVDVRIQNAEAVQRDY